MTKKELKNAIEYIEMFIEDFKYDCQHQKETHSAISSDDEEFKETLKILENIRNELKAQKTPKKYLTFDELEIGKWYICKLNGTVYLVIKNSVFCEQGKEPEVEIFDENKRYICLVTNDERQFFNDLHLELVEE
jgi:hypothetical protein